LTLSVASAPLKSEIPIQYHNTALVPVIGVLLSSALGGMFFTAGGLATAVPERKRKKSGKLLHSADLNAYAVGNFLLTLWDFLRQGFLFIILACSPDGDWEQERALLAVMSQ